MAPFTGSCFPRESGLLLYRGLVKDEIKSQHCRFRKQAPHSSDRERKRVLEILSLLPESQQVNKKCAQGLPARQKRISNAATVFAPKSSSTRNVSRSPYGSHSPKKGAKKNHRTPSLRNTTTEKRRKHETRMLMRSEDYMWHPIRKQRKGSKENTASNKIVIEDVMKHYQAQYHH